MGNSRIPGPLFNDGPWTWSRTPGVLGYNDQADPERSTRLGDSPGAIGMADLGDPALPVAFLGGWCTFGLAARSESGLPLSIASSRIVASCSAAPLPLITRAALKKVFPAGTDDYLDKVAAECNTDLVKYRLDSTLRKAHFFAQVRQEGGAGMNAKVESLNYSPEGVKANFSYYRKHPEEAVTDGYEKTGKKITRHADEEAIANHAYASRGGNGDFASGDGWRFRGRGLIQVTFRSNYAEATTQYRALYGGDVDFEKTPDLMAEFPYAVRSAVCFWVQHKLYELADKGSKDEDADRITAVINLHTDSYGSRRKNLAVALDAFK